MQEEQKAAVIARAGVVVVGLAAVVHGVYLLQNLLGLLARAMAHLWEEGVVWDDWLVLVGALLGPIILLGTGFFLLNKSDSISRKYFSCPALGTEIVVYRAAFAVIGLFLITVAFTKLLALVSNLVTSFFEDLPAELEMGPSYFCPLIVSALVNLCIGLYFFLGAPHLLGWHLKKCREVDRNDGAP